MIFTIWDRASSLFAMLSDELKARVDEWLGWDFHEPTIEEIKKLVEQEDEGELQARFSGRIKFGTAGLRGKMQAGPAFMNHLTVTQASQGLVKTIKSVYEKESPDVQLAVCIGRDGRHNSEQFALLAASAFLSNNIPVYLFEGVVPTPLVAFCVKHLNLAAGVMVTASHNPKDDNGYKVYWQKGSQIVSPVDSQIAKSIEENLKPWDSITTDLSKFTSADSSLLRNPLPEVADAYYKEIKEKCCFYPELNAASKSKIVYTAMHGVGKEWIRRVMETFSHPPNLEVSEQIDPDPNFSTVAFPNPEEGKGALKLAMEKAKAEGARLIVANDPDADRFAAAELLPGGDWKIFTGNELGTLFAHWLWTTHKERNPEVDPSTCVFLNTTVSSKMMKAIADKEGIEYEETLTGFKWLGTLAQQKISEGKTPLLCYEEAIGFLIKDICFDKDGVSATGVFIEMYHYLQEKLSRSLVEHLEEIYKEYGYYATNNRYFFCYDPQKMAEIFNRIRSLGDDGKFSYKCGRFEIAGIRDLTIGYDDNQPDKKPILYVSSSSQMITFYFKNGAVCTLRGSGTEPKLKYYCEMYGADKEETQKELNELVNCVIQEYLQPEKNNLTPPSDD